MNYAKVMKLAGYTESEIDAYGAEECERLDESKYKPGTIRKWGGRDYVKLAGGGWSRVPSDKQKRHGMFTQDPLRTTKRQGKINNRETHTRELSQKFGSDSEKARKSAAKLDKMRARFRKS